MKHVWFTIFLVLLSFISVGALILSIYGINSNDVVYPSCLTKQFATGGSSLNASAINRCVYVDAIGPNPSGLTLTLPYLTSGEFVELFFNPTFTTQSQPFSVTVNAQNTGGPWYLNTTDSSVAYYYVAPNSTEVQQWFAQTQ